MSFTQHMKKIPKLLRNTSDSTVVNDMHDMSAFIRDTYPKLSYQDWSYNTRLQIRFSYTRPKGRKWTIRLISSDNGKTYKIDADSSLTTGSLSCDHCSKEVVRVIIDHAIEYLVKDGNKKSKAIKKTNMVKLSKAGQIKRKLKEISPNLTFEATKYGTYRFSNIYNGFLFVIKDTRVDDRVYRDDLEKMKPLFEWMGAMAEVKPMPKNGLIKCNKGLF